MVFLLTALLTAGLLLGGAFWESRVAAGIAADLDEIGSLRYGCLYIYTAARTPSSVALDAPHQYASIDAFPSGLSARHHLLIGATSDAWRDFSHSWRRSKKVDWPTTQKLLRALNALTHRLDGDASELRRRSVFLFYAGTVVLALLLPWSLYLARALRTVEDEKAGQSAALVGLSNRYAELFQTIPVACFTYDDRGRIVDWNRASETLFARSQSQVAGQPLYAVVMREDRREDVRLLVSEVLLGNSVTGLEWTPEIKGSAPRRTVVTNAFPLRDARGFISGGICVNADVTARRQAEAEQKRLMAEIADSERRMSNVTSRSHCLLWEATVTKKVTVVADPEMYPVSADGTVMSWDMTILQEEETYRWLPVSRATEETFEHAWRDSIPQEDKRRMNVVSDHALRAGLPRYVQEFPCRLADGTERWLLENVEIIALGEDRFELVGICTDITTQKEAEDRLRALADDLERSNQSLQEFAYIASHDLKEPLRKIQTFGGMLSQRAEGALPDDCLLYLERMLSATERMQALIDGLLDYSRAARKPRTIAPTDLGEIVRDVLGDLEVPIERTGARIAVGDLPSFNSDPLQMRQLFQNLIGNALKFHHPGQPPTIAIQSETTADTLRIVVSDQGVGFESRYAERIFDLFEQLETPERGKGSGDAGTGVGLAICRKIVERHGGAIRAASVPGQGTEFVMTFPLLAGSDKSL